MEQIEMQLQPHEAGSLAEEQERIRENLDKGTTCRACHQNAKRYKRKMSCNQAIGLVNLYRLSLRGENSQHIENLGDRHVFCDFQKLRYWGVVTPVKNDDPKKRSSGMWKITEKGIQFVKGEITLPEAAYTYNGQCHGYSENHIHIWDAFKNKFDYEELMKETDYAGTTIR